ncbi:hypothetical protein [Alkanindiges illinoisensis]|uniref:hypothetical protein n=1 Tax=Alkanindiges illinoisensis TaxID=197183 RepID=UPI00047A1060|nr:hypothetical protein [Alkanindiges illinoisensis]
MFGFPRAKILSYNQKARTAQIHIYGMTDGASEGLEATFAYPVGDDDLDTEREILVGADVYIFFQNGDEGLPVVWSYSSHGEGAVEDVRRIRQKNIEILGRENVLVEAPIVTIKAHLVLEGDFTHTGDQTTTGKITATEDVIGGEVSLKSHPHSGVRRGSEQTDPPMPTGT